MNKRKRQPPGQQSRYGPYILAGVIFLLLSLIGAITDNYFHTQTSTTAASSLPDQSVTVLTKALNVRAGPGTGYGIIHSLSKDEQVQVLGVNKDRTWYRISHEAREGWVIADSKLVSFEGNSSRLAIIPNPTYIAPPKAAPVRATSAGSGSSRGSGAAPAKDPSGATAKCVDGTYSYSQHRQGTCSWHGGVAYWINRPPS